MIKKGLSLKRCSNLIDTAKRLANVKPGKIFVNEHKLFIFIENNQNNRNWLQSVEGTKTIKV